VGVDFILQVSYKIELGLKFTSDMVSESILTRLLSHPLSDYLYI